MEEVAVWAMRASINIHYIAKSMPGVGLMVRVVGLGSLGPEFTSHSAVELRNTRWG